MYIYFFETLLYLSFAITAGYLVLRFIPIDSKPVTVVPFQLFLYAILAIPLLSFASIIRSTLILIDFAPGMSFLDVLLIVLSDYPYGHAWIWSLVLGTVLFAVCSFFELQKQWVRWPSALLWCLMVLAHGWASHPSSFSRTWGFLSQSVHVGAVSIWLGILIIVAWFTKGDWNWKRFVKWYTPVSISCMILLVAAGLYMMWLIVDGYVNSWGINYGEALLLKHIIFIPLLLLAFMNAFLSRMKLNHNGIRTWLRIETLLALAILFITGYMGLQEPPHEGEFERPALSKLFRLIHSDIQDVSLLWNWNVLSIICILAGGLSLGLLFLAYKKSKPGLFIVLVSSGVSFPFLGLLLAVN